MQKGGQEGGGTPWLGPGKGRAHPVASLGCQGSLVAYGTLSGA